MRILIDALGARAGGGITYIQNLLPALSRLNERHTFSVLLSSCYQQSLIKIVPTNMHALQVDLPSGPLIRRWWYQQTRLVSLLRRRRIDLLFAPGESSYLRVPARFVMLAGNGSIYFSPHVSGQRRWRMVAYRLARQIPVYLSLQKADRVIFVSAAFRQQVVQQMGLQLAKTRVVYHGVSPLFSREAAPSRAPAGDSYFLSVSTVNPHKNYETLLSAYAQLPQDAPPLLIAGKLLDGLTLSLLRSIIEQGGLADKVHFLGEVAHSELPSLYRGAIALVFPSRLESFGLPLLEAMSAGTPVVASDLPVCREICQDSALYFSPNDVDHLAGILRHLCEETDLRIRLSEGGRRRARHFSWDETARRLVEIFEELE